MLGLVNGLSKNTGLAKSNFTGLAVSFFFSGSVCLAVSIFLRSCLGVSQSKKSKSLGLTDKNASLAISQSLEFTNHHPGQGSCVVHLVLRVDT